MCIKISFGSFYVLLYWSIRKPIRAIHFLIKNILRFQNQSFVSGIEPSFPNCYFNLNLIFCLQNWNLIYGIQALIPESKLQSFVSNLLKQFQTRGFVSTNLKLRFKNQSFVSGLDFCFQNWNLVSGIEASFPNCYSSLNSECCFQNCCFVSRIDILFPQSKPHFQIVKTI